MKKLAPKVSTVSDMRRQLEDMELNSQLNYSMLSNDLFGSIQQQPSINLVLQDNIAGGTKQTDLSAARAAQDRVEKIIKAYKEGKQPNPQQMFGGARSNKTSATTSNKYMLASTYSSSQIGQARGPQQLTWQLGIELSSHGSIRLHNLYLEFAGLGCAVCQGFGHSKTECLTTLKIIMLKKRQPLYCNIYERAVHITRKKVGIYEGEWLFGDALGAACFEQRQYAVQKKTNADAQNMANLVTVFTTELIALRKIQCDYCDGYGHTASDWVTVKLGKRTRVPANAKQDVYGKQVFATYEERCLTKNAMERSMIGFNEARNDFQAVMAAFRSKRAEQRAKQAPNAQKLDPSSSLHDIAKYIKDNLVRGLDPAENVGPVATLDQAQVTAIAVKFEKECNSRLPRMNALPDDQEGRDEQVQGFQQNENALNYVQMQLQTNISDTEKTKYISEMMSDTWQFASDPNSQSPVKTEKLKPDLSNWLCFYWPGAKELGKGDKKQRRWTDLTVCAFLQQFKIYRPNFTGLTARDITKDMPVTGAINLYYTTTYNEAKLMAAFFVDEAAFKLYRKFIWFISNALLEKGSHEYDIAGITEELIKKFDPDVEVNLVMPEGLKYYAHFEKKYTAMVKAAKKVIAEREQMEKERQKQQERPYLFDEEMQDNQQLDAAEEPE